MNQAQTPRFHARDFDPPPRRLSWPAVAVILMLIAAGTNLASALVGFETGRDYGIAQGRADERARQGAETKKAVADRQAHGAFLFPCTKEGFTEYRRTCWHRAQSALTKPKE
jgi:hypothetical protein